MTIETFCLLTRTLHYIFTFGGTGFLLIYKYKSIVNTSQRLITIFLLWVLSNIIFDGCPLTHVENHLTFHIYNQWPMPNYNFRVSWVGRIISS